MRCSCIGGSSGKQEKNDEEILVSGNIKKLSFKELKAATDDFHPANKIGRGGFGVVYKISPYELCRYEHITVSTSRFHNSASLLCAYDIRQTMVVNLCGVLRNGTQVAVKTLSAESKQGLREFLTEIDIISNVRHVNLVKLIGCCVQETNRILVYEYLENKSLDTVLLGSNSKTTILDWEKRSAICKGTATGLAYLHGDIVPPIVHRDIKASNILLDKDFTPKIGDFGLAKLFPDNITHITTQIRGTTGYLAPEYMLGGRLTKKADVFSFGVLVLEIVSGRSSGKTSWGEIQKLLLEWARQLYEEGQLLEMVDPQLEGFPEDKVARYIKIALFCTQATPSRRPTMSQVVDMLSRNTHLNEKELMLSG